MNKKQYEAVVFECPRFKVVKAINEINMYNITTSVDYWYIDAAPWVRIVPITKSGEIYLIKELHCGENITKWRLPGGRVENGEDPQEAAQREMIEEIGLDSKKIDLIFVEIPTASWYRQKGYVYIATELFKTENKMFGEIDENVTPCKTPIHEVLDMANKCVFDAWIEKSIRHAIMIYEKIK